MSKTIDTAGVNFAPMDEFGRFCQTLAKTTIDNPSRLGFEAEPWSYGESCHIMQATRSGINAVGMTIEGLGTKARVADMALKIKIANEASNQTGARYALVSAWWMALAQDCVAMIVNDMITLGILPVNLGMHLAVYDAEWFDWLARWQGLATGWKNSCDEIGCTWGPGETAALEDVIIPGRCELNGAGWGVLPNGQTPLVDGSLLKAGDAIVMVESNGVHANGLTKAREIGAHTGYETEVAPGITYADALLKPTHLYVRPVEECLRALSVHYMCNMTGHGWRKLMRYIDRPFWYVVDQVATAHAEFGFIAGHAGYDLRKMFAAYNMGGGFALMVDEADVVQVIDIFDRYGLRAWRAGTVQKAVNDKRQVELTELDITYTHDELQVR